MFIIIINIDFIIIIININFVIIIINFYCIIGRFYIYYGSENMARGACEGLVHRYAAKYWAVPLPREQSNCRSVQYGLEEI